MEGEKNGVSDPVSVRYTIYGTTCIAIYLQYSYNTLASNLYHLCGTEHL